MKIGIVTFHWSRNYGASMQTFGLKTFLEKKGHNVVLVNYKPNLSKKRESLSSHIKGFILNRLLIIDAYNIRRQKKAFSDFQKEYFGTTSDLIDDIEKIDEQYDLLICGSDQIWNPNLTGNVLDKAYFGIFPNSKCTKVVSYAASIGEKHVPKEYVKEFKEYIKNLELISVRETQMINEIRDYTEKEVVDSIDPTLLLKKQDYEKIIKSTNISQPYLLIYQNTKNPIVYCIAEYIAKKKGIRIVEIAYRRQIGGPKRKQILNAGPKEFLQWYRNASYVVTNTFHGTVFSIIFEKEYISIPLAGREDRVLNLSEKLSLNNRLMEKFDKASIDVVLDDSINYDSVKKKIENERKKATAYIDRAIKLV